MLLYIAAVGGGGKAVTVQSKGQQAAVLFFPTIGSFPGKPLHLNGAAMSTAFPRLLSPLRNRIVSTGHDTVLPVDCQVSPALVAYHAARARGGVGLIVLQVSGVHESARYTSHALMATDDSCMAGRLLGGACHWRLPDTAHGRRGHLRSHTAVLGLVGGQSRLSVHWA